MARRGGVNGNGKRLASQQSVNAVVKSICDVFLRPRGVAAVPEAPPRQAGGQRRAHAHRHRAQFPRRDRQGPRDQRRPGGPHPRLHAVPGLRGAPAEDEEKGNDGGQFVTPREVIRAMVRVVDPRIGKTVYVEDTRTPEELLDLIEAKGREVAVALEGLRALLKTEHGGSA